MTLRRTYEVVCDQCRAVCRHPGFTPADARLEAKRRGWTRIKSSGKGRKDGEDRCPAHPAEGDL